MTYPKDGIYAYWEGNNRHWYYDLCWETVKIWNPDAVLLTRQDVEDVVGKIPDVLENLYVTHRVDWIRKAFISKTGGLWLDLDYICWSDLKPISQSSAAFDFIGYHEWGGGWMDNFFSAKQNSVILNESADYALKIAQKQDISWLSMSSEATNYAINKYRWFKYLQIPTHLISPVSVMDRAWFSSDTGNMNIYEYQSFGFFFKYACIKRLD